jgi:LPXTG-site transpeptidase (sortase) family protein
MLFDRQNHSGFKRGCMLLHYLLLASGGLILALSIWGYVRSSLFQAHLLRAQGQGLENQAPIGGQGNLLQASKRSGDSEDSLFETAGVLGRLEIPRLGVSLFILEGTDQKTLQLAPGHIENTALPGDAGNVAIAGHRDTHFRVLENVRKGDAISIATSEGVFGYTVQWTKVVNPEDVYVLRPSSRSELTLVTCFPFHYIGSAPKRFIVRAVQPE